MSTALGSAKLPLPAAQEVSVPPPCRAVIETVLMFFGDTPATPETSNTRATRFVASLAGAIGHYDQSLGDRIFAVVQPPLHAETVAEVAP